MLSGTHDTILVALSVLIATAASYTALDLAGRIRASPGPTRYAWLATSALAMGGGIWSMHFVAMLAFSVPGLEVNYDFPLTIVSLLAPILVTGISFYVVGRPSTGPMTLLLSGIFMGSGIVVMHYTGMAAMRMPANLHYDRLWVAVSVLIAIGASTVALWLSFRRTELGLKLVASVAMGLAISGMHYSAMQGSAFHGHATDGAHGQASVGQAALAVAVAGTTFLILFLALIAAMFDRRFARLAEREAQALRESEQRFRLLLQSVTDYAIFMLDPGGRVANWNAGAERIKGYREQEILGSPSSVFYTESDRHAGVPEQALHAAAREGKYQGEGWRVRKDGSQFWASVVIHPIKDDADRLIGYAKVTRDITDLRGAQESLQQAQEALFQAQKMEAVGQLTGGVAHDFNNLLTAVLGSLEILRKSMPKDPKLIRLVDIAVKGAERGAALTQRMLAFARRQNLEPTAVDLSELVHGMAELLQRSLGPSIRIDMRLPPGLPRALVDPHQLELAILNLAVNARDAMPNGGMITIAAREDADEVRGGAFLCVEVRDSGEGMDDATLARAKEPFFTTKGVGKGTGLGLSMVHGLAEQSGGRLILKSRRGVGTTAEVWLPVATTVAPTEHGPARDAAESQVAGLKVLVVEDDVLVLMNTTAMLEDLGHHPIEAASGESAIGILRHEPGIDLVLTDQAMPGMTGLQLAQAIRTEWPHLKLILATGFAQLPSDLDPPVEKLAKPFTQADLTASINAVLGKPAGSPTIVAFRSRSSVSR